MPNIPEFNLPSAQSKVEPRSEGASATMRAGRIIQETARSEGESVAAGWRAAGNMVGRAGGLLDDYVTQRDISSAAEAHTRITAQAAKDLPGILANSNDPVTAVQDYYDKTYGPAVEKINQGMMTKRSRMWAAEHSQSGAQAFMRSGVAEAQSIVGARAIQSFQNSVDNLSNAAHSDPHNATAYVDQADSLLNGMKGTLSPAQQIAVEGHRSKVKQQIMISAGHAMADQNPQQFIKDLEGGWGKDHLDAHQRELLTHYATYTAKRQSRVAKGTSTGAMADWINGKYDQESGQDREITPEEIGRIGNNPNVLPEDKKAITRFGVTMNKIQTWMQEHKVKGKGVPTGNAGSELDLRSRLADPNNPTTIDQITDALEDYAKNPHTGISPAKALEIAKKIKPAKAMDLTHLNNHPLVKGELDKADNIISGNSAGDPKSNPAIKGKIDDFRLDTMRTLQEALDRGENWREYVDPKNPKYLFAPERIQRYRPSDKERRDGILQQYPNPEPGQRGITIPPVNPNDSQFLKAQPKIAPAKPKEPIGDFFKGMMNPRAK